MELLQLSYFRTVAKLGHMTEAANTLHVSQPSLSRTISNLEKELGVQLFDRHGRKISLNEYGEKFLARVEHALRELAEGCKEISASYEEESRSIIVSSSLSGFLTGAIADFLEFNPGIALTQRSDGYEDILPLLEKQAVDFALVEKPFFHPGIAWETISNEQMYAVVPKSHPIAKLESVPFSDLVHERIAVPPRGATIRSILEMFCQKMNVSIEPAFEIGDIFSLIRMVNSGSAITCLPTSALYEVIQYRGGVNFESFNHVAAVPIMGKDFHWEIALSPPTGRNKSALSARFHDYCIEYFTKRQKDVDEIIRIFSGTD